VYNIRLFEENTENNCQPVFYYDKINWCEAIGGVKMVTALMILDALVCIALIATVVLQSGKSAGMSGSIAGGAETLFGGKKKGLDETLAKLTMIFGVLMGIITLVLAKLMY
jgi:preprotein translocase subunit SecG